MPPFCELHRRWFEVIRRWPFSGRAEKMISCPDCYRERGDDA